MEKTKKPSSRDVAREAGVSQATVSYVLNNVPGVKIKEETREAVLAAARKLNYYPNEIARSMRLKKAMSIGVVSDKDLSNFRLMKILEGIKDALLPKNYSITLCFDKQNGPIEQAESVRYYRSNRIEGIIFVYAELREEDYRYLHEHKVPFVVINSHQNQSLSNQVQNDMEQALITALLSLKNAGKEEVAFLGLQDRSPLDRRFRGYLKALAACGLPAEERLCMRAPGKAEEIEEYLEAYYAEHQRLPAAILCESAGIGFRLLRFAARKGVTVPEQLSVIAIGSSRFSTLSYPALSTIENPLYEMGYTGSQLLFNLIEGKPAQSIITLEWRFVPRESS